MLRKIARVICFLSLWLLLTTDVEFGRIIMFSIYGLIFGAVFGWKD